MTNNNPRLNGPKRQHFLPKFYLEGFTKEGKLALYDRELDEIRIQQPINTGVIGHFYTLQDSEGRNRYELEHLLSEYEGKSDKVIRKLVGKEDIGAEERTDLAMFIAFAAFRTPDMVDSVKTLNSTFIHDLAKKMFTDLEAVKVWMREKQDLSISEEAIEKEAKELVAFAKSGSYQITTDHRWAVLTTMEMAFNVAPILAGRDWVLLHRENSKKSFITTDAPVVLTTTAPRKNNFYGIGFANADALVMFPLTESTALSIYGNGGGLEHRQANTEQVRHINLALADRCQRFVIGREENLVRSLVDYLGLANKTWQPKMQSS